MFVNKFLSSFAGLATILCAFFAPIQTILYVIIVCVFFDLITAIIRAIKKSKEIKGICNRIKIIKSNKLRRTGIKLFFYIGLVMLVYGAEIALFGRSLFITNTIAGIFIFVELVSVCENADIILETNLFTRTIKKIRTMFERRIEDKIKQPE